MEVRIAAEHLSFHYTDEENKAASPEILKDLSDAGAGDICCRAGTQWLRQVHAGEAHERNPVAHRRKNVGRRHGYCRRNQAL